MLARGPLRLLSAPGSAGGTGLRPLWADRRSPEAQRQRPPAQARAPHELPHHQGGPQLAGGDPYRETRPHLLARAHPLRDILRRQRPAPCGPLRPPPAPPAGSRPLRNGTTTTHLMGASRSAPLPPAASVRIGPHPPPIPRQAQARQAAPGFQQRHPRSTPPARGLRAGGGGPRAPPCGDTRFPPPPGPGPQWPAPRPASPRAGPKPRMPLQGAFPVSTKRVSGFAGRRKPRGGHSC
jgi:hypothetical protein